VPFDRKAALAAISENWTESYETPGLELEARLAKLSAVGFLIGQMTCNMLHSWRRSKARTNKVN